MQEACPLFVPGDPVLRGTEEDLGGGGKGDPEAWLSLLWGDRRQTSSYFSLLLRLMA